MFVVLLPALSFLSLPLTTLTDREGKKWWGLWSSHYSSPFFTFSESSILICCLFIISSLLQQKPSQTNSPIIVLPPLFLLQVKMERALEVKRTGGKEKGKKEVLVEEEGEEEEEDGEDEKRKRGGVVKKGSSSGSGPCCQAETCSTDLTNARRYHRRHRVCELHSKAPIVLVGGLRQRFCQQCSRFHELSEFDETKRSCRRRLAGHNERRRKSSSDSQAGEGAGGRKGSCSNLKESLCRHSEQGGRMPMATTLPATSSYKHFQIR